MEGLLSMGPGLCNAGTFLKILFYGLFEVFPLNLNSKCNFMIIDMSHMINLVVLLAFLKKIQNFGFARCRDIFENPVL